MMSKAAAVVAVVASGTSAAPTEVEVAFKEFVAKYERAYSGPKEELERFSIFNNTYEYIKAENAKGQPFALAINAFADRSSEEFKSTNFGMSAPPVGKGKLWAGVPYLGTDLWSGAPLAKSVDWVAKGAVTGVKNQGQCGSCWSFSTSGALEGAWQIASGKLVSLSEQQLVDCSTSNSGCNGGSMDMAFEFLEKQHVCTENSYPYNGKDTSTGNTCKKSCDEGMPKGSVTGYYDVPTDDTNALMEASAQQPVSIAIEADQMSFQMYSKGILTKKCGSKIDHGVLLVGYGTDNGIDYWKVKNSWGSSWGEEGYVRIERGLKGAGQCGIKSGAVYPKVSSSGPTPSPTPTPAPPSPTPAPTPSGCTDAQDYCTDTFAFKPETDCKIIAFECKKTCGCCGSSPPESCNGSEKTVIV
jgi:hypothetical protein